MDNRASSAAKRWSSQQITGVKPRPITQIHDKDGDVVMTFGIHKDKKIKDLDTDYLKNLCNNVTFKNPDLQAAIETELWGRHDRD
jgi:hypothetical protein